MFTAGLAELKKYEPFAKDRRTIHIVSYNLYDLDGSLDIRRRSSEKIMNVKCGENNCKIISEGKEPAGRDHEHTVDSIAVDKLFSIIEDDL